MSNATKEDRNTDFKIETEAGLQGVKLWQEVLHGHMRAAADILSMKNGINSLCQLVAAFGRYR